MLSCQSCGTPLCPPEWVLCQTCFASLHPAPPLCSQCGSPACPAQGKCENPWIPLVRSPSLPIRSWQAGFLLIEPGYTVLKAWKKRGSPLFDRIILGSAATNMRGVKNVHAIVPIPQRFSRSVQLRRSPAECIAQWLSHQISAEKRVPVVKALRAPKGSSIFAKPVPRQAERKMQERLENPSLFGIDPRETRKIQGAQIALVDDFMTSGRTLRAAAETLHQAGIQEIEVFCLGIRPRMLRF